MSNDTHTATIADFILARVAEDEAAAEDLARLGGSWRVDTCGIFDGKDAVLWDEYCLRSALPHIARHDPARVLAQCKATRAIVESHASFKVDAGNVERSALDRLVSGGAAAGADTILSALAAVYAGHEDYRAEWSL